MTAVASSSRRGAGASIAGHLPAAALGLAAAPILASNGGYFPTTWGWTALALAGGAAVATVARVPSRPSIPEFLFILGFTAFAAWEAIAMRWTSAPAQTPLEVERTLVYVAAALAVKTVVRRRRVPALLGGVLAAIALVCGYALVTRLFPDHFAQNAYASGRLFRPVGYWNGLGLLAAMGTLLGLSLAARASNLMGRALAGATLPILLATLYFTFSRGGWAALALGLTVLIAFDRRRLHLLVVATPLALVSGVTVWLLSTRVGGVTSASAAHDVHRYAAFVAGAAVAAGYAIVVVRAIERRVAVPRRLHRAAGALVAAAALMGLAAVFMQFGSPKQLAERAYHSIVRGQPNAAHGDLNKRLFSLGNNGRLEQWRVALHTFEAHPWVGIGPGAYEQQWNLHRPVNRKVRDAHTLYLETLAESGVVGMALLSVALLAPLAAFWRARRVPLAAGALAAYVAYLGHAAVDWDWELSGVTLCALLCAGTLLAAGRPDRRRAARRWAPLGFAAALALAAFVGLAGNLAMSASRHSVAAGNFAQAERQARHAQELAPWSPQPWQLLAEAQLGLGHRGEAQASLVKALVKTRDDWQLWLDFAQATRGATRAHAIATAEALNPLDTTIPVFGRHLAAPRTGGR